jgi:hypothetical protein
MCLYYAEQAEGSPMQQDVPEIIERCLLDQHREALFLENGGLVIQDDSGILVVLNASSAYHLLELLDDHRHVLQLSQEQSEQGQERSGHV